MNLAVTVQNRAVERTTGTAQLLSCWLGLVALATQGFAAGASDTGTVRGTVTCPDARDCRGAVVWVERIPGVSFPSGPEVVIDQKQLTFVPHVLPIVVGTTVVFLNSDEVWHNIFSASEAKRFNLGSYSQGTSKRLVFDKPGIVELLCNVHSEMSAYIVVTETPFFAMVEPDGSYVLEQVPLGAHTLIAWREELKTQRQQIMVRDQETARLDFVLQR